MEKLRQKRQCPALKCRDISHSLEFQSLFVMSQAGKGLDPEHISSGH
jgi:hypothetical protein